MIMRHLNRVLVFNPNTSTSITDTFIPILSALSLPNTTLTYWTCPVGPPVIKTRADMFESASHCISLLLKIVDDFDGFLGACYADHPIVRLLQSYVGSKPVVGIFDASVDAALQLVGPESQFGIITTGLAFESLLAEGVEQLLLSTQYGGHDQQKHFAGVIASDIGVGDLSPESRPRAREKIMAATARMLCSGSVHVLCVGGVILAGMEGWIREACEAELGIDKGKEIKIIDQLVAGALVLDANLRGKRLVDFSAALR